MYNFKNIPLHIFIEIYCNGNPEAIECDVNKLRNDFDDALAGKDMDRREVFGEAEYLNVHIQQVERLLELCSIGYDEDYINCLRELGYKYDGTELDIEQLDRINNQLNSQRLDLATIQQQVTEQSANSSTINEEWFVEMCLEFRHISGGKVMSIFDLTAQQFVLLYHQYVRYCKQLSKSKAA